MFRQGPRNIFYNVTRVDPMFEQFGRIFLFGDPLDRFSCTSKFVKICSQIERWSPPQKKNKTCKFPVFKGIFINKTFHQLRLRGSSTDFFLGCFFLKFLRPGPLHLLLLLYTLSLGLTDKGAAPETLNISGAISFE